LDLKEDSTVFSLEPGDGAVVNMIIGGGGLMDCGWFKWELQSVGNIGGIEFMSAQKHQRANNW